MGTFEYARAYAEEHLGDFFRYVLQRHFPDLLDLHDAPILFLERIMENQADLIAQWMRVGLIHGVMNTDNMSIAGETIDYGPCAFINSYDPRKVYSSIDHYGRYAFENQPAIAHWNIGCLALALLPLIDKNEERAIEKARITLEKFDGIFQEKYLRMMCGKLGIDEPAIDDKALIDELLSLMQHHSADYTNTFLVLENEEYTRFSTDKELFGDARFANWKHKWLERIQRDGGTLEKAQLIMKRHNPFTIPRNHIVEEALEKAASGGDLIPFNRLYQELSSPYSRKPEWTRYQLPPRDGDESYQTFCGT